MVVLESWAYGICVVTTPVGGLPDVIEEGGNCLTFPFGDSDALAEKLELLITDEQLRNDMMKNAREFVLKTFSTEKINRDICGIYKQLQS